MLLPLLVLFLLLLLLMMLALMLASGNMKNHFWPLTWKGDEWKKLRNIRMKRNVLRWKLGNIEKRGREVERKIRIYVFEEAAPAALAKLWHLFVHKIIFFFTFWSISILFPFFNVKSSRRILPNNFFCLHAGVNFPLFIIFSSTKEEKKTKNNFYVCVYVQEGKRKRKQKKK